VDCDGGWNNTFVHFEFMRKKLLSFIIIIFALFLLPQIIGPITDLITYPQLRKEAENAVQYFSEVSLDDTNNAWFYYSLAEDQFDDSGWNKEIGSYIDGKIAITSSIRTALRKNKQAADLFRDGTKRNFCRIPYEPGILVPISVIMSSNNLSKIVDLVSAQSLMNLESINNEKAITEIFSIITVSEHFASNGDAIDYMTGCMLFYRSYEILKMGLESCAFSEVQLETISNKLKEIEVEWPKFARVLEIESKSTLISLSGQTKGISGHRFSARILLRYINWKYLFSFNFANLGGYRFMNKLSDELEKEEDIDSLKINFGNNLKKNIEERINNYVWKNFMYGMILANIVHLYERKLTRLTRMRILNLCSEVQLYRLRTGHYPMTLENFNRRTSIDLNTGEYFNYTNYGDSAVISSFGPDPTDKGDDVLLTLTDIGVKQYLKRKRDSSKENGVRLEFGI